MLFNDYDTGWLWFNLVKPIIVIIIYNNKSTFGDGIYYPRNGDTGDGADGIQWISQQVKKNPRLV